ncbi:MAG: MBL fold metallo-hydrolase, partial [Pseudomonadota bacterium]|nr:MBL fold metallo-hydrolase [Pseudomonadota bacterium]
PDHFAVRFQSNGAGAVVGGDLMHCPVQCMHPDWRARPDFDPPMAVETRRKFMNTYAETDTLVCMMHFPLPSCGGFAPQDNGFRFTYDKQDW